MEILFSAKEVKAMLNLCTLLCCEAVIEYSKPGDPFFMEANALFQVGCVGIGKLWSDK